MNKYCKALIRFYHSKYLILIIISFGILLRFNQYIFERPLWYDEILAFDIFEFESSQLFQNIDHLRLAYPFGFFVVERFLFKVFGGFRFLFFMDLQKSA